mgnify:CR=1 FL=1
MAQKVLIVEDEKAISRVMELKMKQAGFEVEVAENGAKAIERTQEVQFDCVLLDLILPEKDGFQVLEAIRQTRPDTKVVVLTNLGQPEDRERVMELGVLGYYVKSEMSIHTLVQKIQELIQS